MEQSSSEEAYSCSATQIIHSHGVQRHITGHRSQTSSRPCVTIVTYVIFTVRN
jgi:hypothetical protein